MRARANKSGITLQRLKKAESKPSRNQNRTDSPANSKRPLIRRIFSGRFELAGEISSQFESKLGNSIAEKEKPAAISTLFVKGSRQSGRTPGLGTRAS